ncbi:MAG TPA: hypothetical protein VFT71_08505 [Candidatus Nitrosocosmicus sp.]|nr:hypothetical protein [Candidatus Nitrosocosmicus sp.]
MTNYSIDIIESLTSWTKQLQDCKGDSKCIEQCGNDLRKRMDAVFPSSTKLEFENDKISYIFSTIFFLSNRLNKALVGLAETDKAITSLVSEAQTTVDHKSNNQERQVFQNTLNRVLSDYY